MVKGHLLVAAGITPECPESCLSTAGRTRWSVLAAFSIASELLSLRHVVAMHRVLCRATSDSVATRGIEGFSCVFAVCHRGVDRARERVKYMMHEWYSVYDAVRPRSDGLDHR